MWHSLKSCHPIITVANEGIEFIFAVKLLQYYSIFQCESLKIVNISYECSIQYLFRIIK